MTSARSTVRAGYVGFFLVALPLLLAVGPKECPGVMDVQCGDVLDVDHGWYRLNGDLVCPFNPSFAAVTVTGKGVHFNLAGYTITRDDDTGRFLQRGILVRGAHARIRGGSVVGFNCPDTQDPACAGISLREAPGVRIHGMSVNENTVGIGSASVGGLVGNVDGALIIGNDITGNLRGGIILAGAGGATAEGARIVGNDLSDTGGFPGFPSVGALLTSDGVSLIGNVANDCATGGVLLFGNENAAAERNTIRDNTTLDNGSFGIGLDAFEEAFRPRDNLIQSNASFGNGVRDLGEGIPRVGPFADCLNTWKDNDFDVASPDCIE